MKKIILSLFVVLVTTTSVFGQAKTEREIKNLFAQIEKTNDDGKRTQIANQIQHKMIDAIFEAEDFFYDFPSLLSHQLKIITSYFFLFLTFTSSLYVQMSFL